MSDQAPLLIEIGTEELPPRSLWPLAQALGRGLEGALLEAGLRAPQAGAVEIYATPRRLAVRCDGVLLRAPDRARERRGPALKAAYDASGAPTRATQGFAEACGVAVADLQVLETDKGSWLVHRSTQVGEHAVDLIPALLTQQLRALPIERRMRWGAGYAGEFVRPVQWCVALLGGDIVPLEVYGCAAGRASRGHRFHHPQPVPLHGPQDYVRALEAAHVLADFMARRERVAGAVEAAARALGAHAQMPAALLDEVTALTEWPVAISGQFDPAFLEVPAEVLVACMQGHQRYFPLRRPDGGLAPAFIAVANLDSTRPAQIRAGYERVLRARLADARYFWDSDRRTTLAARAPELAQVVFQAQLGTLADKSRRLAALAGALARMTKGDAAAAQRAATLAKADLLTAMVGEFPELQGVMGAYYAGHDGEADAVATALGEQYLPRHAGDALPVTDAGRCLALADRLDTLVGIFSIGLEPSGDKDPFGLRRAALGVARILIESPLALHLPDALAHGAHGFGDTPQAQAAATRVYDFILERLPAYYEAQGHRADLIEAVLARCPAQLDRMDQRVRAVAAFRRLPEAGSLIAANKRIGNLLGKAGAREQDGVVRQALLHEPAEQALADAVALAEAEIAPAVAGGDYGQVCLRLARLRTPVDAFFDQVMVLTDDAALRANRLALLHRLHALFLDVADFTLLQGA